MGRTACPACGANVDAGHDNVTGEVVVVEIATDASGDARRYRLVSAGPPMLFERVPDDAPGDFFPDHYFDCKDANAGRTY
jgi:hypothetical protein